MKITDVKIRRIFIIPPLFNKSLKAIVSVTFDDALAVHDIKIVEGSERLFVAMPSRLNMDKTYSDVVHPINKEMRQELEDAVFTAYQAAIKSAEIERK